MARAARQVCTDPIVPAAAAQHASEEGVLCDTALLEQEVLLVPRADAFLVGGNARGGKGHIERMAHDVEVAGLGKELRVERDVETVVGGLVRPAGLALLAGEVGEQAVDELTQARQHAVGRHAKIAGESVLAGREALEQRHDVVAGMIRQPRGFRPAGDVGVAVEQRAQECRARSRHPEDQDGRFLHDTDTSNGSRAMP